MHNYNPPKTKKPIKSGELQKNLHPKDYEFVKNYDIKTIKPLVDASSYLNIKSLADVCICRIATEYFIEPSMAGIEKAK
jgi:S-phase kinase-associated protein 1